MTKNLTGKGISKRFDQLASSLEDTSHNLRAVDRLIDTYRDIRTDQISGTHRSRQDGSLDHSRKYQESSPPRHLAMQQPPSLGVMAGAMSNGCVHSLHQELRDISSEQGRLRREVETISHQHTSVPNQQSHSNGFTGSVAIDHRLAEALEVLRVGRLAAHECSSGQQSVRSAPGGERGPRLLQSEVERKMAQSEVDRLRRQVSQEEGAQGLLRRQLTESQRRAEETNDKNIQLKKRVKELEDQKASFSRDTESVESMRRDREKLEREVSHLRDQLRHMSPRSEVEEAKREKNEMEKSRNDLKEQVSRLTADLDERRSCTSRLMDEVKEANQRAETAHKTCVEAEASATRSREELDDGRRCERDAVEKAERMERMLQSEQVKAEQEKELMQAEREEVKLQCEQQERELKRVKTSLAEDSARAERAEREVEKLSNNLKTLQSESSALRRDMQTVLDERCRLETAMRKVDGEGESLRLRVIELDARLESEEREKEKLQFEVSAIERDFSASHVERARLEEHCEAQEKAQELLTNHIAAAQEQVKKVEAEKVALQVSYQSCLSQLKEMESQEQDIATLRKEVDELRYGERTKVKKLHKKLSATESCANAKLGELHDQLLVEQAATREALARCQRATEEAAMRLEERWTVEQEMATVRAQYERAAEQLREQSNSQGTSGEPRLRQLESDVSMWKGRVDAAVTERDLAFRCLRDDLNELVELANSLKDDTGAPLPAAPSSDSSDPCSLRSRLVWLRGILVRWSSALTEARSRATGAETRLTKVQVSQTQRDKVEQQLLTDLEELRENLEKEVKVCKTDQIDGSYESGDRDKELMALIEKEQDRVHQTCQRLDHALTSIRSDLESIRHLHDHDRGDLENIRHLHDHNRGDLENIRHLHDHDPSYEQRTTLPTRSHSPPRHPSSPILHTKSKRVRIKDAHDVYQV